MNELQSGVDMNDRLVDMMKMIKEGKTFAEIGRKYNISRERVRQLLDREGVNSPLTRKDFSRFEYLKELLKTKTYKEVSALTKYSTTRLGQIRKKYFPEQKLIRRRTNTKKYKVEYLIELYNKCNGSYKMMGEILNLKKSAISSVMHRYGLDKEYVANRKRIKEVPLLKS